MAASLGVAVLPMPGHAAALPNLAAVLHSDPDQGLVGFYRARADRPLWFEGGKVHPASAVLVDILRRSLLDGMKNGPELAALVEQAVARAGAGQAGDVADAELLLSRAWVEYVKTLRRPSDVGMVYAAGVSSPAAPFTAQVLGAAGSASDLSAHLRQASDLNPVYSQLRAGLAAWQKKGKLAAPGLGAREVEQKLRLNLDRARALPLSGNGTFILVDAASARMFFYENGRVRDSMRVVVGKTDEATPMVAGMIQNAVLNPYWNVPPDLVRKRAATVLKDGVASLEGKNFQLLSDWSATPRQLDAKTVDWAEVANGSKELRIRQLPGIGNAMGEIKFNFPNDYGIYLHDTPDKSIFGKADRKLSSGCVRVEDAKRLATWLFGRVPSTSSKAPEQVVALPKAMPVYVTYLTAGWDGERIALSPDGYRRDIGATQMALAAAPRVTSYTR